MAERKCAACNQLQPASAEGDKCLYCGAELPVPEEPAAEPSAPEPQTPLPAAAPAEEPVPEGKRKCPNCAEILYETEKRCWRCGHEVEPPAATIAPPVMPPAEEPTAPPVAPPTVAAPPVAAPPPYVVPTVPAVPPVDPAAQNLGVWALVVGLASWFCCPIIGSIIAIYLGVQAKNRGVTGLGIAGMVLGIISLLVYLPIAILTIIGLIVGESSSSTTPEATSWLWSLQWMLS